MGHWPGAVPWPVSVRVSTELTKRCRKGHSLPDCLPPCIPARKIDFKVRPDTVTGWLPRMAQYGPD